MDYNKNLLSNELFTGKFHSLSRPDSYRDS